MEAIVGGTTGSLQKCLRMAIFEGVLPDRIEPEQDMEIDAKAFLLGSCWEAPSPPPGKLLGSWEAPSRSRKKLLGSSLPSFWEAAGKLPLSWEAAGELPLPSHKLRTSEATPSQLQTADVCSHP